MANRWATIVSVHVGFCAISAHFQIWRRAANAVDRNKGRRQAYSSVSYAHTQTNFGIIKKCAAILRKHTFICTLCMVHNTTVDSFICSVARSLSSLLELLVKFFALFCPCSFSCVFRPRSLLSPSPAQFSWVIFQWHTGEYYSLNRWSFFFQIEISNRSWIFPL